MNLHVIILAGGAGTRMFSARPKVLHPIGGTPLLLHVVKAAEELSPTAIHLIYGHNGQQLQEALPDLPVNWVHQAEQLGTGHAVSQALPFIPRDAHVLILSGDVPLIQAATLRTLIEKARSQLTLLVATLDNPFGLGRIIRDESNIITAIIEEKDATNEQKNIKEIYSGICYVSAEKLEKWLPLLDNNNAQKEYYITDIIKIAVAENCAITSYAAPDFTEIRGINDRFECQEIERIWQYKNAKKLLLQGVGVSDAHRIDVRGSLTCGRDVFIDVNCVFEGNVYLGDNCIIEPNCYLSNATLGNGCHVLANSIIKNSVIGDNCHLGPFARLREGTQLENDCKIGNFVETKKITMRHHSKASHLTYLGDATIGAHVNIGAGTITCNYDGANKHATHIGDHVFVGSGTQLIAPITLEDYATIGAGTTLRHDAPANALTVTLGKQKTIMAWNRPQKENVE